MSDERLARDDDEREWEAERRDFVADAREDLADIRERRSDEREALADERERLADEREASADLREAQLDERAAALGEPLPDAARRASERAARRDAAAWRAADRAERAEAAEQRVVAAQRRQEVRTACDAAQQGTRLTRLFAELATDLFAEELLEDVLAHVIQAALATLDGCEMASITVRGEDGKLKTTVSSHPIAVAVDALQFEVNEGPCIDALDQGVVYSPTFPDSRWPLLGDGPIRVGALSTLSYSLAFGPSDGALAASLNSYGREPHAFDEEAQEVGFILAAHSALAAHVVRERERFRQAGEQFQEALVSRDVIGQAKGILMERMHLSPEDTFDRLRRASQQLNHKLRDVAERLAQTGELGSPTGDSV